MLRGVQIRGRKNELGAREREIEQAKRIYTEMFAEVGREAEQTAGTQQQAQEAANNNEPLSAPETASSQVMPDSFADLVQQVAPAVVNINIDVAEIITGRRGHLQHTIEQLETIIRAMRTAARA